MNIDVGLGLGVGEVVGLGLGELLGEVVGAGLADDEATGETLALGLAVDAFCEGVAEGKGVPDCPGDGVMSGNAVWPGEAAEGPGEAGPDRGSGGATIVHPARAMVVKELTVRIFISFLNPKPRENLG